MQADSENTALIKIIEGWRLETIKAPGLVITFPPHLEGELRAYDRVLKLLRGEQPKTQ